MPQLVSSPLGFRPVLLTGFAILLATASGACGRSDLFGARHHCAGTPGCSPDGGPRPDGAKLRSPKPDGSTDGPIFGPKRPGTAAGARAGGGGTGTGGGAGRGGAGGRAGTGGAAGRGGTAGAAGRGGAAGGPRRRDGRRGGGMAGGRPDAAARPVAARRDARVCVHTGKDDNCNLLSDCQDPGCFGDPGCAPPGQEICNNTPR